MKMARFGDRNPRSKLTVVFVLLALLCFSFSIPIVSAQDSCTGKTAGYYCKDSSSYVWCYGQSSALSQACPTGTTCQCGFTTSNPCTFPSQKPSPCSGAPGSVFGGGGASPAPTASAAPSPTATASAAPAPTASASPTASAAPAPTASATPKPTTSAAPSPTASASVAPAPAPGGGGKKIVGYFTNWAQYRPGNCKFTAEMVDASKFTHINYAFAKIQPDNTIIGYEWNDETSPEGTPGQFAKINALKSKNPNLKTLLSVGGWTHGAGPFSTMAESAGSRATFISSSMKYVRKHGFDGIDLDWEYPVNAAQGGRPQDFQNFPALLKEYRAAIEKETLQSGQSKLLLTLATAAGPSTAKEAYDFANVHPHVDWINIMTYDLHGAWETTTGAHTALYSKTDDLSIDSAVKLYMDKGVPANKLVLGVGTYGRAWTVSSSGATAYGASASGAGPAGTCTREAGFMSYYEIKQLGGTTKYDADTHTMIMTKGNAFVTYDNVDTMKEKMDYINSKKMGGAMVWAIDLDDNYELINVMNSKMR